MMEPLETNGVAETIDDVEVPVEEESEVELVLIVASVSVADVSGADVSGAGVAVEALSSAVVEASFAELGEAASVVGAASCRAIGRTTPAKATLRHKSRVRRAHSRPDTAVALIVATRGWASAAASQQHYLGNNWNPNPEKSFEKGHKLPWMLPNALTSRSSRA